MKFRQKSRPLVAWMFVFAICVFAVTAVPALAGVAQNQQANLNTANQFWNVNQANLQVNTAAVATGMNVNLVVQAIQPDNLSSMTITVNSGIAPTYDSAAMNANTTANPTNIYTATFNTGPIAKVYNMEATTATATNWRSGLSPGAKKTSIMVSGISSGGAVCLDQPAEMTVAKLPG